MTIIDIERTKKGELALRATKDRYRALVTASSEEFYLLSPDWFEMRQLNSRGFLALMDKPSRTWLRDYIPEEDRLRLTAVLQEPIREKAIFQWGAPDRAPGRHGGLDLVESGADPQSDR